VAARRPKGPNSQIRSEPIPQISIELGLQSKASGEAELHQKLLLHTIAHGHRQVNVRRESLAVATAFARIAPDTRASVLIRASAAARLPQRSHHQRTSLARAMQYKGSQCKIATPTESNS
jgi:hypothetical protein